MKKEAKDYIVFPLDVPSAAEARQLVRALDTRVGMFKIGLELFIQEGPSVVKMVRDLSPAGIFLDLKLHDISATVGRAMARVADLGVDLVTVHASAPVSMLEKAVQGGQGRTGVLGVTLLTDNDAHAVKAAGFKDDYSADTGRLVMLRARAAFDAGCSGVVCSGREAGIVKSSFGSGFLAVTPGIRPAWTLTADDDQKRVTTPARAIEQGADYLVIGRPIRDAADPAEAAGKVAMEVSRALESNPVA